MWSADFAFLWSSAAGSIHDSQFTGLGSLFNDSLQSPASNNPAFPAAAPAELPSFRLPPFESSCSLSRSAHPSPDSRRGIARHDFLFVQERRAQSLLKPSADFSNRARYAS